MQSKQWHLAARPVGEPKTSDFTLVTVDLPEPAPGEVLVRNTAMSVDPYMRGRMNDVKSYAPPWQIGQVADGGAVGEVIASTVDALEVGDLVVHGQGWREHGLGPAEQFRKIDASQVPDSAYLGVLGMPGLTAYAGLFDVAGFTEGETVFVSGAAGAVGSLVGQFAGLRGGTAIGSAGSAEKVAWLTELGFAQAFNYKDGPVLPQLTAAAPDGIDVYFDNVGGEHLEAAISALKVHGRAAICGMISPVQQHRGRPRAPQHADDHRQAAHPARAARQRPPGPAARLRPRRRRLARRGQLTFRETVVDGLESAPDAFIGMLRGDNTGKMVVRLS